MSNARLNVPSAVIWTKLGLILALAGAPLLTPPARASIAELGLRVELQPQPRLLDALYLQQEVLGWLSREPNLSAAELSARIHDLYLQSGYPGVAVAARQIADGWRIALTEVAPGRTRVRHIEISGGTPRERYIAGLILRQQEQQPLDRETLLGDLDWLDNNYFLPLAPHYVEVGDNQVDLQLSMVSGTGIYPTGNLALNRQVGLAVTAGVILDNLFDSGQIVRAMGKRNNLPFPGYTVPNVVQDWEYTLSWSGLTPLPGVSAGINHYNKVDYIYSEFNGHAGEMLWIRSLGVDLFSGFPIWSDPVQRRFVRGAVNLTLVEDRFNLGSRSGEPVIDTPESLTSSGKDADLLLIPSLTVAYSDIDNYRLPSRGNFLQTRVSGGLLDASYIQATFTGNSYWSPYVDDHQQWTLLLRSAAGTSFGTHPPFYRGFLNTGAWLVRGQTEYSVNEKHSLRFAEELHYIYKPTPIEIDRDLDLLIGQSSYGLLDNWAIDLNAFLDQGASWRDSVVPRGVQLSLGGGINFISPGGTILGLDLATPIYPTPGGFSAILRISSPFSYTLYSDWGNTNGYFLR